MCRADDQNMVLTACMLHGKMGSSLYWTKTFSIVRIQILMCLLLQFLEVSKLRCLETDWDPAWAIYYFNVHGWKQ